MSHRLWAMIPDKRILYRVRDRRKSWLEIEQTMLWLHVFRFSIFAFHATTRLAAAMTTRNCGLFDQIWNQVMEVEIHLLWLLGVGASAHQRNGSTIKIDIGFSFGGGSYRKNKKENGLNRSRLGFTCEFQMALESSSICSDSYDGVNGQHRIPKKIAEGRQ